MHVNQVTKKLYSYLHYRALYLSNGSSHYLSNEILFYFCSLLKLDVSAQNWIFIVLWSLSLALAVAKSFEIPWIQKNSEVIKIFHELYVINSTLIKKNNLDGIS